MAQILIIDDNQEIREMIEEILKREKYEVITAEDGEEGMKVFRNKPTSLVITDVIMPNKDGAEIIFELNSDFPDVPVIAISGGGKLKAEECLGMVKAVPNVKCILSKPFARAELLEEVKNLIG